MSVYLNYAKPNDIQIRIDEMLAIQSEVDTWREKKASGKVDAWYNKVLNDGFENH